MSNFFALDQLAKSHQCELRQEAKYAAQLREMSCGSRRSFVQSRWKWAVALGAAALLALLAVVSQSGPI